jgi:hypothetical protein
MTARRPKFLAPAIAVVRKSQWAMGPRGMISERAVVGPDRERDVEFEFCWNVEFEFVGRDVPS